MGVELLSVDVFPDLDSIDFVASHRGTGSAGFLAFGRTIETDDAQWVDLGHDCSSIQSVPCLLLDDRDVTAGALDWTILALDPTSTDPEHQRDSNGKHRDPHELTFVVLQKN